jgi:hypothetical protein
MLFCSEQFLLFYSAIFLAYWALPWHRGRVWLLLGASFYFYASWNWWLACVIGASTTLDYFLARGMEASDSRRRRRLLLLLSVTANLGLLCYFKYANFFLRSLEESLRAGGASVSLPVLRIILPIGISFYTFEAINYTVDVYRRRVRAERSLANFMLFILFFPHLVAGPIVRARDFLPQVRRRKRWNWARFDTGVQLLLMGVFKKLAIADRMAGFADPVFANPTAYNTGALWMGALAYALQVYCDFSGYTDIARGAAHLLGYRLAENFNVPYLSANIAALAHLSLHLVSRLSVHSPGRQPGQPLADGPEPCHHDDLGRTLARRSLAIRRLRRHARRLAHLASPLPGMVQPAPATRVGAGVRPRDGAADRRNLRDVCVHARDLPGGVPRLGSDDGSANGAAELGNECSTAPVRFGVHRALGGGVSRPGLAG